MLFLHIAVALFAVFGFFCAVSAFLELLFASDRITAAVEVRERRDVDELDMLLAEARGAFLRKGKTRLVVLLSTDLMDGTVGEGDELHDEYADLLDRYGAECYLIEPD